MQRCRRIVLRNSMCIQGHTCALPLSAKPNRGMAQAAHTVCLQDKQCSRCSSSSPYLALSLLRCCQRLLRLLQLRLLLLEVLLHLVVVCCVAAHHAATHALAACCLLLRCVARGVRLSRCLHLRQQPHTQQLSSISSHGLVPNEHVRSAMHDDLPEQVDSAATQHPRRLPLQMLAQASGMCGFCLCAAPEARMAYGVIAMA